MVFLYGHIVGGLWVAVCIAAGTRCWIRVFDKLMVTVYSEGGPSIWAASLRVAPLSLRLHLRHLSQRRVLFYGFFTQATLYPGLWSRYV